MRKSNKSYFPFDNVPDEDKYRTKPTRGHKLFAAGVALTLTLVLVAAGIIDQNTHTGNTTTDKYAFILLLIAGALMLSLFLFGKLRLKDKN